MVGHDYDILGPERESALPWMSADVMRDDDDAQPFVARWDEYESQNLDYNHLSPLLGDVDVDVAMPFFG